MTRRESEEAALDRLAHPLTDESDHTYEQDVRTIREALRLAHAREDAIRRQCANVVTGMRGKILDILDGDK